MSTGESYFSSLLTSIPLAHSMVSSITSTFTLGKDTFTVRPFESKENEGRVENQDQQQKLMLAGASSFSSPPSPPILSAHSLVSSSTSTFTLGKDTFAVRPFTSKNNCQDQLHLSEMCKDVWNGTDYLPDVAQTFEEDPTCDFIIMEHSKTKEMVAAGNRRIFDEVGNSMWIEALRVSSQWKGRGLATEAMRVLRQRSVDAGATEVLFCTINGNRAMKRVFKKEGVDMFHTWTVLCGDFNKLALLPGWSPDSINAEDGVEAKHILKALDVEHLVSEKARSETWTTVQSVEEFQSILATLRDHGRSGHLPGLGKLHWMSDNLKSSIRKGMVRTLTKSNGDPPILMAFVKETGIDKIIGSSDYACSIVATSSHDFDAAVWEACREDYLSNLDGNPAFAILVEGHIPCTADSLMEKLPFRAASNFLIYRWERNDEVGSTMKR